MTTFNYDILKPLRRKHFIIDTVPLNVTSNPNICETNWQMWEVNALKFRPLLNIVNNLLPGSGRMQPPPPPSITHAHCKSGHNNLPANYVY